MEFFNSAIEVLQTLVVALGAGLGVWGGVNLLEGYGSDNPGSKLPEDKRPIGRWGRLHNLISWQFDILPTHFHRNLQRQKWVQGKG